MRFKLLSSKVTEADPKNRLLYIRKPVFDMGIDPVGMSESYTLMRPSAFSAGT